ncbi:MAG: CRISPR-associated endonuclease Cas1 [Planctomycetaceae bacterium]
MRRTTSITTTIAHLVGPGKLKVTNAWLAYARVNEPPLRIDPRPLRQVYCYGDVSLSDEALKLLCQHKINAVLLSPGGHECRGHLVLDQDSSAALRRAQHEVCRDPALRLRLACDLVHDKLQSQRDAARHYQRHGTRAAGTADQALATLQSRMRAAESLDQLRGWEGQASALWFDLYGQLLQSPWSFTTRNRRPPRDPVNALLSLGYTWLSNRVELEIRARGLEVTQGIYHDLRPGRPSLACDVIEPFRVPWVDRWVLKICHEGHLRPDQFQPQPDGAVFVPRDSFGKLLASWEDHLEQHGFNSICQQRLDQLCHQLRHPPTPSPTPH